MKKTIALLLALAMVMALFAGCANDDVDVTTTAPDASSESTTASTEGEQLVVESFDGKYTYTDWTTQLSATWNPHTYETSDQSYPLDYTTVGFYSFIFNDELHPVDGKEPYAGYKIVPEMAASEPVDVTAQVKAEHPEFGIPEQAESGYAYTIDLNQNATWQDGTPIKAVDYIESMKRLLDPKLLNYRANGYYTGSFVLVGAENYALQGQSVLTDNGVSGAYTVADLVKGEDGNYTTPDGQPVYVAVDYAISQMGGYSLKQYVDAYGATYFTLDHWDELVAAMNEEGLAPLNDDTLAWITDVTATNPSWNETDGLSVPNYFVYNAVYGETTFDTVGLYESGEYQITFVLKKSLAGFNLLYSLTSNWLVKCDAYDACLKEETTASGTVYSSTYNTSVETAWSYGPYVIDAYQRDKSMHFTKNENWYGYTDGEHVYKDPSNGKIYPMFMTTDIDCQVINEVATAKEMFFAGQLMQYGLQSDDYAAYSKSEYCHFTPGTAIYFMILNGNMDAIVERENSDGFDTTKYDLETLTLTSFHRALGLAYDKQEYCDKFSPAQSPAFGLIGNAYIYDPDTGAKYRDTDYAKQAICNVYGVDATAYESLDAAVATITGYDPVAAKDWFQEAYKEALELGYITDNDGDGISDQTIKLTYSLGGNNEASDKMKQIIQWLTDCANKCAEGTGFEGKILYEVSAPLGDAWADQIKAGTKDIVMAGWTGSTMDPYGLFEVYTNDSYQYDAAWFDASSVPVTLTIDGEEITMSLTQWQEALVGTAQEVGDNYYNFGEGVVDQDTRLSILAALEEEVLLHYNYLPFTQAGSMALLSQKAFYVVEDYNPVMGRGGITYLRYNYNDTEWDEYVASGELKY